MTIIVWIFQILLAAYFLIGGIYMVNHYRFLGSVWALNALPQPIWIGIGILQVLLAVGLVLPKRENVLRRQISLSAICLAILSLLGSVLYASYTGTGIFWALLPALLLAFIAYKRWHE